MYSFSCDSNREIVYTSGKSIRPSYLQRFTNPVQVYTTIDLGYTILRSRGIARALHQSRGSWNCHLEHWLGCDGHWILTRVVLTIAHTQAKGEHPASRPRLHYR